MYKRAVGIAKRKFEERRRNELESMMRNLADGGNGEEAGYDRGGGEGSGIGKVYDEVGRGRKLLRCVENILRRY